jgi:hypothetical protein
MAYENRTVQSSTNYSLPSGTDPLVDNTSSGDVQAVKILDPTAGSTTPMVGQKARTGSMPVALSTEDAALLDDLLTGADLTAAGLATATKQDTGNTSLASIDTKIGEVQASPTANTVLDRLKAIATALSGTLAVSGTFWQATQPVSAASLPLPSGAATAAKQPALGTAGSPSSDVISVQGISGGTSLPTTRQSRAAASTNVHAPASNTAAVVTYSAGGSGVAHVISGVAWSYGGAPTSGNLKIEDGSGTTVFSVDVTAAGPGFIPFNPPLKGTANTAMIVTLAAGGSGVSGKVSVLGKWTE